MTGSLQTKNDMFYMVLNTYVEGKRKQQWIPTHLTVKGNKRKAEQLLRETLHEYELKSGVVPSDVTLADYVRYWLTVIKQKVDPVTFQGYEELANTHILPYFENLDIKLRDVTLAILQTYFDEKHICGRTDGTGGLSPRTLILHKNVLNQTLDEAVKTGVLLFNPCQYLDLPKVERYKPNFYTGQQLYEFLVAIQNEPLYPFLVVTLLHGLRRSEALGLKWNSVNFEENIFTIEHTVVRVTQVVKKDNTKNCSSYRSFPLLDEVRDIFQTAKLEEEENRQLFGKEYQDNDYIFKWPDGHPYCPDYPTKKFSALLKKYGFPHIRLHDLRHSCASLLLYLGFSLKDIQEWLGHADIKMTGNIYGHLDVTRKQEMAHKLSGALFHPC